MTDEKKQDAPDELETLAADAAPELDVEALDLTVESVEERISPSETNVFDK